MLISHVHLVNIKASDSGPNAVGRSGQRRCERAGPQGQAWVETNTGGGGQVAETRGADVHELLDGIVTVLCS